MNIGCPPARQESKKLTGCVRRNGAPVAAETFNSGTKAAAGFSVTNSGQYFVRVRLEEERRRSLLPLQLQMKLRQLLPIAAALS
jgi:hypothetical protein